ncbi:leucine-rich repeat domain-containing protein [Prevotella sp. kh1p2]|uniref:leucine-rich repeat domain-containing protein n=1 Tax=Prevotella sp. kh1p2 TaxID=1761883 RepID=UPI0008B1B381|nr:leucine-rich repeat domain-containing protein [Prevotella sp. kh1p2]SES65104.1 Leucine rich repeat-containing protein [Prevotella sp. kh1p2]SNU10031.1 Leucine rich repeat-containing protein [Prevotellaceae bacterium KH2P17]
MKRTLLLWVALLAVLVAKATPTITTSGDTLVITVNANGDLAARNFTTAQLAATNVKIVTADAVKLTNTDMDQFYGVVNSVYNPIFTKMTDLNLALAEVTNNDVLASLGVASPKMNGGKQLGSLVLPENLTETKFTFNDNKSKWTKVVFPNATKTANKGTTVIGASVFSGNTWIQSVVIGTSVSSVANMAFNGCTNLTEVEYEYGMTHVDSHAFWGCTGLTTVILPESVTEIGKGAFENCTNITTLRLPNSLKYIRSEAFDHTSISSVIIPASVEMIERGAFGNINTLTDVYVLGENTKAQNQAFLPTDYTYGYSLPNSTNGATVNIGDYTTKTGLHTVLHYPAGAYEKYVNRYTRVIGTSQYASSGYPDWNNKWVYDADGNKLPVLADAYFGQSSGDYAGWNEFMLTAKLKGTYRDERLIDSKWYSVCFPFDLDEKQIGNAFGSATEVCEFSGVPVGTNPDGSKYITLQFKDSVKTMKAHHPYMIHPGLHGATYNMIMDVTIDTDTDNDQFAAKLKRESKDITADGVVYTFIGNHTDGAKVPKYSYYYYSGKDTTKWPNGFYKAMRTDAVFTPHTAVVKLSRDNGVSGAARQNFFAKTFRILDGETTGINGINGTDAVNNANSQNVYNIYGQIVRSGSASVDNLPAGVYIVNGKKYIVK